ncbi:MAG: ribosome small subunit-dependent GTPase A [Steroidobacteraceae bacterium]
MKSPRPTHHEVDSFEGRVIASHGRRVKLEGPDGSTQDCQLAGRKLRLVCGDRVRWQVQAVSGGEGLVTEVLPRRSQLERISLSGQHEVVVANLDQLIAVVAPIPEPDFGLCDRYLAAAEWQGLNAAVVLNKADLPESDNPRVEAELQTYRELGYPVVRASRDRGGTTSLERLLQGHVSVLVGQSGVGKSSLINRMIPGVAATVGEISAATEEGRHTTTTSALYHLPDGGELMDSPGVRDFSPPLPGQRDVAQGFRELQAASTGCRFPDCRHDAEPGCEAKRRLAAGLINPRRFDSYLGLLRLAARYSGQRR